MAKKLLNVTISEELIEVLKTNSEKGKLSEYTEEMIRAGLNLTNNSKDDFAELLRIVKKLNEDRKNGHITFS